METTLAHLQAMEKYFSFGATLSHEFRKEQLQKLKKSLYQYEEDIYKALYADLKKVRRKVGSLK